MKNQSLFKDWLRRAKSNLERAKAGKISEGVVYEDLCFDCQQAVEKSLKALLVYRDVVFPRTHSISLLLELVADAGINIPDEIKDSVILTEYAVSTRYPGDYEPVDENEYKEAVQLAEKVIGWIGAGISEADLEDAGDLPTCNGRDHHDGAE
jgi:HEPN domain-containing protein